MNPRLDIRIRSRRRGWSGSLWRLVLTATVAAALVDGVDGQSQTTATKAPAAPVKTWTVPRLPDGDPDLEGVWNYGTATPLERSPQWAGKATLTEPEAVAWEKQSAQRRSAGNAT